MADPNEPLGASSIQHAILEAKQAGATDQQIADYFWQRAPQNVREMYFRTPGLGAPQQGFFGTVGREAEILGAHALAPWATAGHAVGLPVPTGDEVRSWAPPPATPGERVLGDVAGTAGVVGPLALAAGPAALPFALGAMGGTALPAARREYLPGLSNIPYVSPAIDIGLGVVGGAGLAGVGTSLARSAAEAAPELMGTASATAPAYMRGPPRPVPAGTNPFAIQPAPTVAPYPSTWAPAASSGAGTARTVGRGFIGPAAGEAADFMARHVLGLPPDWSQLIGLGVGTVVGGGTHLPSASPASRFGALAGGVTQGVEQMTLPDVNVTAPAPTQQQ